MIKPVFLRLITLLCSGVYGQKSKDKSLEYLKKGNTQLDNGDLKKAIESYNKAIDDNSENLEAYYFRGVAKNRLNKDYEL